MQDTDVLVWKDLSYVLIGMEAGAGLSGRQSVYVLSVPEGPAGQLGPPGLSHPYISSPKGAAPSPCNRATSQC